MVNLGWVPLDSKDDISKEPPVEPITFDNNMFNPIQCKYVIFKTQ